MPTVKLSATTKSRLDSFMAHELQSRLARATPQQKKEILLRLIKSTYGLTYNQAIGILLDTRGTK